MVTSDYNLDRLIYHTIYRTENKQIILFEQKMNTINLKNIKVTSIRDNNIIKYGDGLNLYSYNISDSQLYLSFNLNDPIDSLNLP